MFGISVQLNTQHLQNAISLFAFLACLSFGQTLSFDASPQEVLIDKFFGRSRLLSDVPPKKNLSDPKPLKVHFTFIISNVFDIKLDEEEIDLGIWVAMHWKNELVSWNRSEYRTEFLEVPARKVWIPSIIIQQKVVTEKLVPTGNNAVVIVHPDGVTTLDFGTRIKLTCSMSACLFPIDTHKCPLTFISISQNSDMVMLVPDYQARRYYSEFSQGSTGLWQIKTHDFEAYTRYLIMTGGYLRHLSILDTYLTFKHKPNHYWLHLLFPIALICAVTFFAALFPKEGGDRTALLITCFLAQFFYLDTVLRIVPKTSDYVPMLIIFIYVVLVFTAAQLGLTAITAYYAEKANKNSVLSPWHQKIIMILSKICLLGLFSNKKKNDVKLAKENGGFSNEIKLASTPSLESNNAPSRASICDTKEDGSIEGNAENEAKESEAGDQVKICKTMCKVIDRFSVILSLIVVVATPMVFQFIYDGTIKYKCNNLS